MRRDFCSLRPGRSCPLPDRRFRGRELSDQRGWRPSGRASLALGLSVALLLAGCHLVIEPEVEYLSNEELLEIIGVSSGLLLPEDQFRLFHAQVLGDFVLLDFRGVAFPGDRATIRRISVKSTEQRPDRLVDVNALLDILRESRRDLEVIDREEEVLEESTLCYATYTFRSPIHDEEGVPHPAKGIAGTLHCEVDGNSVVYWFNLDNWGDRAELSRKAIEPLLERMRG